MTTTRRITFTYFIKEDGDDLANCDDYIRKLRDSRHFRGCCYQLERCATTGREHLQGYVEYDKPRKFSSILQDFPHGTHVEIARGDRASNVAYCSKSDTRVLGPWIDPCLQSQKLGKQGSRTDIIDFGRQIMSGELDKSSVALERPDMVLRYPRGVSELFAARSLEHKRSLRTNIQVEVVYGKAGTGKTRYAARNLGETFILDGSNSDTLWFDGYSGESTLVIDDFYGWIRHGTLLRLLDVYPYRCPIKGSHCYAEWTKVYITSNRHPSTWYDKFSWDEDLPLQRRIHRIWNVSQTMFGFIWTCEKTGMTMSFDNDFTLIN